MLSVNCYGTSCFTGAKMINQLEIWLLYIGCWWVGTPVDMARGRCFQRMSNMKRICTRWLLLVSELVAVTHLCPCASECRIREKNPLLSGCIFWSSNLKVAFKGGAKIHTLNIAFFKFTYLLHFFDVTYFHTARGPALRQVLSHQCIQCITAHPQ